jgi:5'-nucleotidase
MLAVHKHLAPFRKDSMRQLLPLALLPAIAACATVQPPVASAPVEVQILGLNDFHGNLQPSGPVTYEFDGGKQVVPAQGGAAQLGGVLQRLRTERSITVAAGDLIGATPLESAYFLDEPTIGALNLIGLELAAVGNHEFDRGSAELLRMQNGGCAKLTSMAGRVPCRLEPFTGARFQYLAANVKTADGGTLLPATAIRRFGPVTVGFIGMTLKDTGNLVTPGGVAGLTFGDEAATANALVPALKSQGADTVVLLIHQGGKVPEAYRENDCAGLAGDILPILDGLDPSIRTVVSGHTHNAYACTVERGGATRLLTSAGKYGYFATDIRLRFDPRSRALVSQAARNVAVPASEPRQSAVAQLVDRYVAASRPIADRVVGRLSAALAYKDGQIETQVADLIADAQLAATRAPNRGAAQLSLMNNSGARASLVPDAGGGVTYGQLFALQPFGNSLVVRTFTGAQVKAVLEQQFALQNGVLKLRNSLVPSGNVRISYSLSAPAGDRIREVTINGKRLDPAARYRVVVNSFLASGGDGFSVLTQGSDSFDAGLDLDATEAWLATGPALPKGGRLVEVK